MDANSPSLEDLVIPILLQSADGYKPMVAKRKFEAIAGVLARQAYWLSWGESLAKMPKLSAVRFKTPGRGSREPIQTPIWREGAVATERDLAGFEAARRRALSKLYGKQAPGEPELLQASFGTSSLYDKAIGAADIEPAMARALGPQIGAMRTSRRERSELEGLLWEPDEPAGAKPKGAAPRL